MTLPTSILSRPSIDIAHHRIHEGNHFTVHKISTGIVAPKYFLIIPPPVQLGGRTIEMHLIFEVDSDMGGTLEFFESPTITDNGIDLSSIIKNNNRRSSTTSQVTIFENPTVTNDGTPLFQQRKGTATTGTELGEFRRSDEEFVLNPSDKYILKFTPLGITGANITVELNWYDNRPSSPVPIP